MTPRFLRIVEIGSVSHHVLEHTKQSFEKVWTKWRRLHPNDPCEDPFSLNLVAFGAVDFVCIQELPDLKALGVPATRTRARFQRSSGAWTVAPCPIFVRERPYVAICYLKLNALADVVAGHVLPHKIIETLQSYADEKHLTGSIWPLFGLDTAQVIVVMATADLDEVKDFAWYLRGMTLKTVSAVDCARKHLAESENINFEQHFDEQRPLESVGLLSWSHSLVGLPEQFMSGMPDEFLTDHQKILLRTRFRLMPGCKTPPVGAKVHSVFGNHDLVQQTENPKNSEILNALRIALPPPPDGEHKAAVGPGYERDFIVETEVEFLSENQYEHHVDEATARFLLDMRWPPRILKQFPNWVRNRTFLGPSTWSYQRLNGAVNLLLAFSQRFSDPFDVGQTWRLRRLLKIWIDAISEHGPQDDELVRWTKHLERVIRLDDAQEDPSYRPSLPLSFASRGGYVSLREAFIAYIDEAVEKRSVRNSGHKLKIPLPLIVDSTETRLTLKRALNTFILLVSGLQIQTLPLWPYVVHEIEHLCLDAVCGFSAPLPKYDYIEALCDVAMIDSGAIGEGDADQMLERAARVIAWSMAASIREAPTQFVITGPKGRSVPLRLAYLWMLVFGREMNLACLDEAVNSEWWRKWTRILCEADHEKLRKHTIRAFKRERDVGVHAKVRPTIRSQSQLGPCGQVIAELVKDLPDDVNSIKQAEVGLVLGATQICTALERLREPVWKARRAHVVDVRDHKPELKL